MQMERQKEDCERKLKLMEADLMSAEERLYSTKEQLDTLEKQLDDTQRFENNALSGINIVIVIELSQLDPAQVTNTCYISSIWYILSRAT